MEDNLAFTEELLLNISFSQFKIWAKIHFMLLLPWETEAKSYPSNKVQFIFVKLLIHRHHVPIASQPIIINKNCCTNTAVYSFKALYEQ